MHYRIVIVLLYAFGSDPDPLVAVNTPKVNARAGEEVVIRVRVSVKEGYHIQAHDAGEDLIPTTIRLDDRKGLTVLPAVFPPSKKFRLDGTDDHLDVYDGEFEIRLPVHLHDLAPGEYSLQADLRYQACDNARCFFPRTLTFTILLIVA